MRTFAVIAAALALLSGAASAETLSVGRAELAFPLPDGAQARPPLVLGKGRIHQYVGEKAPAGEGREEVWAFVFDLSAIPDLKTAMTRAGEAFAINCAVAPLLEPPRIASEDGVPVGVAVMRCGRSAAHDGAEAGVLKAFAGKDGYFMVQRAVRLPAVARSEDLAVPQAELEREQALLAATRLCESGPCAGR